MASEVPIKSIDGIELLPSHRGIATAVVKDFDGWKNLSWDRYVRLKKSAEQVKELKVGRILDAGGYDGAIGFFLPGVQIDVIDPATTGGSVLNIEAEDKSYDAVVAIDVLEHIEPASRTKALTEFSRVAAKHVILNYPCQDSKEAQELALKLTNNALIREHVEWDLPDSNWVLKELDKVGFKGSVRPHTSIAIWLGQYVALNLIPETQSLNLHLIEHYSDEPSSRYLYHLVATSRLTNQI